MQTRTQDCLFNLQRSGGCLAAVVLLLQAYTSTAASPPVITQHPFSQVVQQGGRAVLNVQFTGTAPLALQWFFNGAAIAGATQSAFAFESFQPGQSGEYFCIIDNTAGSAISRTARLVLPSKVNAWGTNATGAANPPDAVTNAIAVSAGLHHSLALKSDGRVVAWGDNSQHQTNVPANVTNAVAISAGGYHNLVLKRDGNVAAWGNNVHGQTNVPTLLSNVIAISASPGSGAVADEAHSMALLSNGKVVAWGNNGMGQTNVPAGLTNVIAIAAGGRYSVALTREGVVVAWGDPSQTTVPPEATNIIAIAAGWEHSVALRADGTVLAWGMNTFGQADVPAGLSGVMAITAGSRHSLAVKWDGSMVAWGANDSGQTNVPAGLRNVAGVACGGSFNLALDVRWSFLVFGDSRGSFPEDAVNGEILSELAAATTNESAAFILFPGDLVYSGSAATFQQWTNIMQPVYQAGIGVYPVLGNHDAADINAFTTVFGPGVPNNGPAGEIDRTYAIAHNGVLVLGLDVYVNVRRVNQPWIDAVLSTNTHPHVFAFGHEPAFKASHYDCLDDYPAERDAFWTALSNAGAIAYFCGHDHYYNHARLDDGDGNSDNDVHQFIVGTAGAPFYGSYAYDGSNGRWTPTPVFHENQFGYVKVEICAGEVALTWHRRTAPGVYEAGADRLARAVSRLPVLIGEPSSRTNLAGTTATFEVLAAGPAPLTFQWLRDGQPITGATNNVYSLLTCNQTDAGVYSAVVSNVFGIANSQPAILRVLADTNPPILQVTHPAPGTRILNTTNPAGLMPVRGTISDNARVVSVLYGLNGGAVTNVTQLVSTNNGVSGTWSANVVLRPGPNELLFRALDYSANEAMTSILSHFDVPSSLTLSVSGPGTLVPSGFTGSQLFVGRSYKVLASVAAAPNYVLSNVTYTANGEAGCLFTNTTVLPSATVSFVMKSNLFLNASFVPNPLAQHGGTFNGLFFETNVPPGVRHESAGFVTLTVRPTFFASGKLWVDGNVVPFSGKLRIDGTMANQVVQRANLGKSNLLLSIDMHFTSGIDDQVTGSVVDAEGGWASALVADRCVWRTNTGQQAFQFTNTYTLVLPGFANEADGPLGASWATARVTPLGRVTLSGKMGDGAIIAQSTTISRIGVWPLFAAMYPTTNRTVEVNGVIRRIRENHGMLLGWLRFQEDTSGFTTNMAPNGAVDWIKTWWTNEWWPNGFTNQAYVESSRWLAPRTREGEKLWAGAITNLLISVESESLGSFNVTNIAVLTNNVLSAPVDAPHRLRAVLSLRNGVLSGSFYNSNAVPPRLVPWKGVLLQNQTNGAGAFMIPTGSGKITVEAQ